MLRTLWQCWTPPLSPVKGERIGGTVRIQAEVHSRIDLLTPAQAAAQSHPGEKIFEASIAVTDTQVNRSDAL